MDKPVGDMPDSITVNGHMFVHVAACPCPRIQGTEAEQFIRRLLTFEEYGKERVHTFAGGEGAAIGADWDADYAREYIRSALRIGTPRESFRGHYLVLGADGRHIYFEAHPTE